MDGERKKRELYNVEKMNLETKKHFLSLLHYLR